jgi:hypothetical protein
VTTPTASSGGDVRSHSRGKTLRGAKGPSGPAGPPVGRDGPRHPRRAGQRHVDRAPGEVPAFQPLLADLDLAGVVVTVDALHTHAETAEFLVTHKQAHYLAVVKASRLDEPAQPIKAA